MQIKNKLLLNTNWEEIIPAYLEKLEDRKIIIWGTKGGADLVYKLLKEFDVDKNIIFFVERNLKGLEGQKHGLKVISLETFLSTKDSLNNYTIIIASMFLNDIKKDLLKFGFKEDSIDIRLFGMAKDYLEYIDESVKTIVEENIVEFNEVYNLLEDEFSKHVFLGLMNSKLALDNLFLNNISSEAKEQYFDKVLIQLKDNEVFVDCGSYDGDTFEIFYNLTGNQYKKYIAIEADPNNFKKFNEKILKNNYKNIDTYNLACWDEQTTLKFESNLTAGHINSTGEIEIAANRLDNILNNETITFIKMDIEGAEEKALNGAIKTIEKNMPILAICIYHNLHDYFKLPLLIKSISNEYVFYIRHYTKLVDQETVLYAIPRNRLNKM